MKKILFLIIFLTSLFFLSALSPNVFSDNANAAACGTIVNGCETSGTCNTGFTCKLVGTCNYSCIANISCTGTGGVCQNTACGAAGSHGGSCNTGLTCCNPGVSNTCASQGGSCKDSATCASEGGSNIGAVNCAPNICCTPPGGGGGGGSQPPPPGTTVGDGSSCYSEGSPCTINNSSYTDKPCCRGLVCGREAGPDTGTVCKTPYQPATDPGCANGTSCNTAVGAIQTDGAGFVKSLFAVLLSISGGIATILIIISGYRLMTSQGNPEKLQLAKEQLTAAIIGILFIIFSLVILQSIGVNILQLPGFSGV